MNDGRGGAQIADRAHQVKVFGHIGANGSRGAWVWTCRHAGRPRQPARR
jgi:hypothetical protein